MTSFLILLCHSSSSSFPPEFSYTHVCPLICLAISHFCGRGWPLAASTTYSCYMLLKPEEGGYQCQMPCCHPWRHKLCFFWSNDFLWLYYHHLSIFLYTIEPNNWNGIFIFYNRQLKKICKILAKNDLVLHDLY